MSSLKDLQTVLATTEPPLQLLQYLPNGKVTPLYMYEAVTKLNNGDYHRGPYSYEEKYAICQAKRAADLDGRQPRSDEVYRNILIGNNYSVEEPAYLKLKGVTHLLNTCGKESEPDCARPNPFHFKKNGLEHLSLEIVDLPDVKISDFFMTATAWMDAAIKSGGKVLVNCWQGASRSATIVLAYLVKYEKLELTEALRLVRSKRDVRPNDGFLLQLIEFEEMCKKQ